MVNYTIIKYGRWGRISPTPEGKLAIMLNKKMSYEKQGAEFMPCRLWAVVKFYKRDKGLFPWGFRSLVESIMAEWLRYSGESYEMPNYFYSLNNDNLIFFDKELREYQKKAIYMLSALSGGILCIPTGGGKTRVAIEYIKQLNVNTLITVHTKELLRQWKELTKDIPNCLVITYQSLKNKELLKNFNLVIFDECHHVAAKNLYNVAMSCPNAQLVGLSATPRREDGEDMKIEAALGKIVYSISRRELIDQGFLCDAKVYYHEISPSKHNFWETYHEAYQSYIVDNEERNNLIVKIAHEEFDKGKKVLILCSQIDHINKLLEKLQRPHLMINGRLNNKTRVSVVNDINSSQNGLIVLASTVFDEGIDFPHLDTIILAAGGKSSIKLTQRVGRILRKKEGKDMAIIHDMKDICKWCSIHYKKRRELLEQDFEVVDI